jgi:zinc protease
LLVAARGVAWDDADYEPLFLLNVLLGGSFSSRLNLNLRETNSYSYGAGSQFGRWRGPGLFEIRSSVASERTAESMRQIADEIARLVSRPLDVQELATLKRAARRHLALSGLSLESLTDAVAQLAVYDRPANYYDESSLQIDRITANDLWRVAQRYLTPDKLRWIVVGDAAATREQIAALGLGSLRVEQLKKSK